MKIISELEAIHDNLKTLIPNSEIDGEKFIDNINGYLTALEDWQSRHKEELGYLSKSKIDPGLPENSALEVVRPKLKSILEKIEQEHKLVFEKAKLVLDDVGEEIGKVTRSSKVIKRYLDMGSVATLNVKKEG